MWKKVVYGVVLPAMAASLVLSVRALRVLSKKLLLGLGLGLLCHAALGAVDDMHWFKTELTCADARLTVRAFCQETDHAGATVQFNSLCSRQSLVIERPGQSAVVRDLLEHQSRQGEPPLLLWSLQCVAAGGNTYLSGQMANGGNCRGCERSVLLGLDGRWKRDGRRWLVGAQEKRTIVAQQGRWNDSKQVFITNTTPASACTVPGEAQLRDVWNAFRRDAMRDAPANMERYFQFPLKFIPPYHDQKPPMVSRTAFRKNYAAIFLKNDVGEELDIHHRLHKTTGNEPSSPIHVDRTSCRLQVRVNLSDYEFDFHQQRGWIITAVRYGNDYESMKSSRSDR